MTLNTEESDTLQFVKVDGPMERLIKIYDTSPERCVPGAVPGVGFKLIDSAFEFEDHTFCMAEYSKILPFCVNGPKISLHYKLLH